MYNIKEAGFSGFFCLLQFELAKMDTISFYKYQGTGNDFVMIDDRPETFNRDDTKLVNLLCDRRFGIGADGLILLRNHSQYDFEMVYYNADGFEGSMCGNGGRCIVQFAHDLGIIKDTTHFIAVDGEHEAEIKEGLVHLKMSPVQKYEQNQDHFFMDTGSPHYVEFVDTVSDLNVYERGQAIRYNDRFKTIGTNVNFAEKTSETSLSVRPYERGVEDETLACGTGVTACVLSAALVGMKSPVDVKVLGGQLRVSFTKTKDGFANIYLIGPAKQVFKGETTF